MILLLTHLISCNTHIPMTEHELEVRLRRAALEAVVVATLLQL